MSGTTEVDMEAQEIAARGEVVEGAPALCSAGCKSAAAPSIADPAGRRFEWQVWPDHTDIAIVERGGAPGVVAWVRDMQTCERICDFLNADYEARR